MDFGSAKAKQLPDVLLLNCTVLSANQSQNIIAFLPHQRVLRVLFALVFAQAVAFRPQILKGSHGDQPLNAVILVVKVVLHAWPVWVVELLCDTAHANELKRLDVFYKSYKVSIVDCKLDLLLRAKSLNKASQNLFVLCSLFQVNILQLDVGLVE